MSLYKDASLVMIPSAYKDGRLYSIRPVEELGSELVTNGDFGNGSTGWDAVGDVTIANGVATFEDSGSNTNSVIDQTILTASKTYKVVVEVSRYVQGRMQIVAGSNTHNIDITDGVGNYSIYLESVNGSLFRVKRNGGYPNFDFDVNNVSVKEVITNGDFTFSRGSNLAATRVDVNGLIEKGRENLLLQSNTFDTTWLSDRMVLTSGQVDKDGGATAWKIAPNTDNNTHRTRQVVSVSGVQTYSIYAKSAGYDWLFLYINGSYAYFNLSTGTIGNTGSIIDSEIVASTNGYYRCSITYSNSVTNAEIYVADSNGSYVFAGNGTDGIYIQDAQLEAGLVATDYIETGASTAQAGILEDMPRLDYSGGASCPSLKLEPQRTNLIGQSEYFDSWTKVGSPTITNNYGISPEGLTNSTRLETTSDRIAYDLVTINANETFSIYMKGSGTLRMQVGDDNFYPSVTSDWVRYEFKTTQAGNRNLQIRGNGSAVDVELYGAQYERASYPTSYIPNHSGGSVTRSLDSCVATSVSDLIGQTQGTFYWEGALEENPSGANMQFALSDGTTSQQIKFVVSSSSTYVAAEVKNGGVQQFYNNHNIDAKTNRKYAIAYKANDFAFYIDGTQIATDTSGSVPACTKISFDNGVAANNIHGVFNNVILFPTRLSNAELAALTE